MFDPSLMIAPDIGGRIGNAIQQAQKTREQTIAKGAMAALVQDPNNPRALAALAQVDPSTAMQFKQAQAEQVKAQLAQHQDSIIKGAQILRQFAPKDQQSYMAALMAAQQAGIDVSQVPQQYNPQYVDGVVKLADALKPQTEVQDPGIIREYDIATQRGLVPKGTTYEQYVTMRNPGMTAPVTVPYGATVTPPGGPTSSPPKVTDAQSYNALPPGTQYIDPEGHVRTKGGQSQPGSGGFR